MAIKKHHIGFGLIGLVIAKYLGFFKLCLLLLPLEEILISKVFGIPLTTAFIIMGIILLVWEWINYF